MIANYSKVARAIENIEEYGNYLGKVDLEKNKTMACQTREWHYETQKADYELFEYQEKNIMSHNFNELVKSARESSYGDLSKVETTLNKNVRNSFEIVNDLKISEGDGDHMLENILANVSRQLFCHKRIKVEINKLVIYSEGCFFKKHQDTPRPGAIGTLICVLPNEFRGGIFNLDDKIEVEYKAGKYQFLAFYGNLPHEITPVESGLRASIVMHIYYDEEEDDYEYDDDADEEDYDEYVKEIEDDNDDGASFLEKCEISAPAGIILSNVYSSFEINLNQLKGTDLELYEKMREQFSCTIVPVLLHYSSEYYRDTYNRAREKQCRVYEFSEAEIERVSGRGRGRAREKPDPMKFYGFCNNSLREHFISWCEHTGNECQPEEVNNFYYQVALILRAH